MDEVRQGDDVRSICVAVSPAGDYRVVRSLENGRTERMQGKIPAEEFQQLRKALFSAGFRGLAGNHGGMIRQQAESFAAELPVPGDKTQRLQWLNADGDNPFPVPVAKIVNWLRNFEPRNGKELEYSEFSDVCPTVGFRLVQPAVAANLNP